MALSFFVCCHRMKEARRSGFVFAAERLEKAIVALKDAASTGIGDSVDNLEDATHEYRRRPALLKDRTYAVAISKVDEKADEIFQNI